MNIYPAQAKNILVIQLRQVGDVLLTTPAVKVLRDAYPQSRISFLTETGPAVLLQGNPHIDEIITRKRRSAWQEEMRLIRRVWQAKFDLVIDFFGNPRSAWLSLLTRAPHRIAPYNAGRAWCYTYTPKIQQKTRYAAEEKLALLETIGIVGKLVPPVLHISAAAEQYIEAFLTQYGIPSDQSPQPPVITIDLTSRRQTKRWIPERYVELADRLAEQYDAKVIFIWEPGEKEEVEALLTRSRHRHILAYPTNLMQLAALIAKSDLHIGNCSAPRHIAVAVGTPSLIVMGPTSPEDWTYPSPLHRVAQGNVPCLGCQKTSCQKHECMQSLTVEDVEQIATALLMMK